MRNQHFYHISVDTDMSKPFLIMCLETHLYCLAKYALFTVKILKFGTPQTIAIIVLKIEKFDVTSHKCIQKMLMEWQTA